MNDSKAIWQSRAFWLNVAAMVVAIGTLFLDQDFVKNNPNWTKAFVLIVAVANIVVRFLTTVPVHIIALFLAFILPLGVCQAACRHITPMPSSYPADGQVILGTMSGEVDSFWSTPITVRYGNYDWPADNATGISGGKGWRCWAMFARGRDTWTVHRAWEPAPLLFDPHTGSKLP